TIAVLTLWTKSIRTMLPAGKKDAIARSATNVVREITADPNAGAALLTVDASLHSITRGRRPSLVQGDRTAKIAGGITFVATSAQAAFSTVELARILTNTKPTAGPISIAAAPNTNRPLLW